MVLAPRRAPRGRLIDLSERTGASLRVGEDPRVLGRHLGRRVRLPDELAALLDLRSLMLLLRHVYVHDWERPAHFPPRFEQSPEALFRLLSASPRLSALTLGEPESFGWPLKVFVRLPAEFTGLQALSGYVDASPEELGVIFPNAVFGRPILDGEGRMLGAEDGVEYRWPQDR